MPSLLQRMMERTVGDLLVRRRGIYEPLSGRCVARDFPSETAAVNAALRMNEVTDWIGVLKTRANGRSPNCQSELEEIAKNFGGKLATGAKGTSVEEHCARIVRAYERT